MFKRAIKIIQLGVFISIFLTGCTSEKETSTIAVAPQREKLVLWSYYETKAQKESLDILIEEFNNN